MITADSQTFDASATPEQRLAALQGLVHTLNADREPIVLGPFTSELGFEAIYWLPFVAHLAKSVADFKKRAVVITRGGAGVLYRHLVSGGVDLYGLRSVTDVRRAGLKAQRKTGLQKQVSVTPWEADVIRDGMKAMRLGLPYHLVHPAWMYWGLAPYWDERAGMAYLSQVCDFAPLPVPDLPAGIQLPPQFVAVKFYGRATFPHPHPETTNFVKTTVATLAAQTPVVVLQSADAYDDHTDIAVTGPNITSLGAGVAPHENLALQAAVLGRCTAFVGTYGGVAQLALRLGKPSVSFWTQFGGTAAGHHSLNWWISQQTHVPFLTGSLVDTHIWSQVTGLPTVVPAVKTLPMPGQVVA